MFKVESVDLERPYFPGQLPVDTFDFITPLKNHIAIYFNEWRQKKFYIILINGLI